MTLSFCFSREIASSKSFADTGSIVKVVRSRKSILFFISLSGIISGISFNSANTCSGKTRGNPYCLITLNISTSGSPAFPNTSVTSPIGSFCNSLFPQFMIFRTTFSPGFASFKSLILKLV